MKHIKVAAGCMSGLLALTLVACGAQQSSTSVTEEKKDSAVEQVAQTDTKQILGKESKDALEIATTNGLGKSITSFQTRVSGTEKYSDNLVASGKKVAKDEEVRLFVAKPEKADATYDLRVMVEGNNTALEFVSVPVTNIKSMTLKEADGVAYVDYVDAKGTKGSTKDAATKAKQNADEQKKAQDSSSNTEKVNAESVAVESGGQETTVAPTDAGNVDYSESYVEESTGDEGYNDPENVAPEPTVDVAPAEEPAPAADPAPAAEPVETPSAPEQSGDACMGDVVLR